MTKDVNLMPSEAVVAAPKKRRKKIASLDRRKARAGWLFVLPFVLGFVLIYLPMIYDSFMLTFQWKSNITGELTFVGFDNYIAAFTKQNTFLQVLLGGLQTLALDIPCILIFSLFMAIMLNQDMGGRAFFRAIFFMPVVLSTGIMESINALDTNMDMAGGGIDTGATAGAEGGGGIAAGGVITVTDIEQLFGGMKVGADVVGFIVDLVNNIYDIVNRSGVQMLIFLAALQSISPAIYESCKIDGASSWETFWKITLPMLSPMILVNAVYTIIDSFTSTENAVMKYISGVISDTALYEGHSTEASTAMSWVYFLIVVLIVAAIAAICSAFVFYQRKSD